MTVISPAKEKKNERIKNIVWFLFIALALLFIFGVAGRGDVEVYRAEQVVMAR